MTETKFGLTATVASIPGEVETTSTAIALPKLREDVKRSEMRVITIDRRARTSRLSSRFVITHYIFYNSGMPTYQYLCTECGHAFEVVQSFSDDALTSCEECEGQVRKVYNSVGIVFKGSGFYKTDSRSSTAEKSPSTPVEAKKSETSTPTSTVAKE